MDVIGGVGVGSQLLIVYRTNKQHPERQAPTAADTVTFAAVGSMLPQEPSQGTSAV